MACIDVSLYVHSFYGQATLYSIRRNKPLKMQRPGVSQWSVNQLLIAISLVEPI